MREVELGMNAKIAIRAFAKWLDERGYEPTGYYVEEFAGGSWRRGATAHMYAKREDAEAQMRDLQERSAGTQFRVVP